MNPIGLQEETSYWDGTTSKLLQLGNELLVSSESPLTFLFLDKLRLLWRPPFSRCPLGAMISLGRAHHP